MNSFARSVELLETCGSLLRFLTSRDQSLIWTRCSVIHRCEMVGVVSLDFCGLFCKKVPNFLEQMICGICMFVDIC